MQVTMGEKSNAFQNSEFIEANQGQRLLSVSSSKEEGALRQRSAKEEKAGS